jgi:hypothetical protein
VVGQLIEESGVLLELVGGEQGASVALVGDDALDGDQVVGELDGAVDVAAAVA